MGCFDRNNNVAVEYVYYRKVGDHATNMPNNVLGVRKAIFTQ